MTKELTSVEATGVLACVELLGNEHPTSLLLTRWLVELGVTATPGTLEELLSGVSKAVEYCKLHHVVYPNVVNVRPLLIGRKIARRTSEPETVTTTRKRTS